MAECPIFYYWLHVHWDLDVLIVFLRSNLMLMSSSIDDGRFDDLNFEDYCSFYNCVLFSSGHFPLRPLKLAVKCVINIIYHCCSKCSVLVAQLLLLLPTIIWSFHPGIVTRMIYTSHMFLCALCFERVEKLIAWYFEIRTVLLVLFALHVESLLLKFLT